MSLAHQPMAPVRPMPGPPVFSGALKVVSAERSGPLARLRFEVPDAFAGARAGQFALLSALRPGAPLLGRPISVILGPMLEFAFAVVGAGTAALAEAEPGEAVQVTGPLGNSFAAAERASLIVCDATHFGTFVALAQERAAAGAPADLLYVSGEGPIRALDEPVLSWLRPPFRSAKVVPLSALSQALDPCAGATVAAGARDAVMAVLQRRAASASLTAEAAVQAPMACGLGVCQVCIRTTRQGAPFLVCETPVVPIATPVFAP
ncbi:MAG: hypothetical protein AAGF49_05815 [Pseudomonadota bacterium]